MAGTTIVASAAMREQVACGARTYVVRPLTFGEVSALAAAEAAEWHGGDAMLAETVRRALEAKHGLPEARRAALVAAVTEAEESADEWAALQLCRPDAEEPVADRAAWRRECQAAMRRRQAALRGRSVAEAEVGDSAEVAAARAAQHRAAAARRRDMVAMALVGWSGEGLPEWPDAGATAEAVDSLPAADVLAVAARVDAMCRPGAAEGKG